MFEAAQAVEQRGGAKTDTTLTETTNVGLIPSIARLMVTRERGVRELMRDKLSRKGMTDIPAYTT